MIVLVFGSRFEKLLEQACYVFVKTKCAQLGLPFR